MDNINLLTVEDFLQNQSSGSKIPPVDKMTNQDLQNIVKHINLLISISIELNLKEISTLESLSELYNQVYERRNIKGYDYSPQKGDIYIADKPLEERIREAKKRELDERISKEQEENGVFAGFMIEEYPDPEMVKLFKKFR